MFLPVGLRLAAVRGTKRLREGDPGNTLPSHGDGSLDEGNDMARESLGLLQGTVDVLILKTLSWKPLHGYAVADLIRQRSDGDLAVEDAALYQALHRLERKGLVESEWGTTDGNRRARFYSITADGRKQLRTNVAELRRYVSALFRVLEPA